MKKNICVLIAFLFVYQITKAKPVTPNEAKSVAISFYKQHSDKALKNVNLVYTETSTVGSPIFYVFNINSNDGFVIITAEDAARPVIGYSTHQQFIAPQKNTPIAHWMKNKTQEILAIREANIQATEKITKEWAGNFDQPSANKLSENTSIMSVAPLVQTTWSQSPGYNDSCPGGSVTGCVATAMAQIMRYWNYPTTGISSSSYCDCKINGFKNDFGTLSANYSATTYHWANMPLNTSNGEVAKLMSHCGISVNMDYDPNESGAYVIAGDAPICSQTSYTNYFGYDPNTIKGLYKSDYVEQDWIDLLKKELNAGRPVQYVGDDPTQGGHTWVCDGYDINDNFHMNWGWGGYDDGYYTVSNLTTIDGYYNFSHYQQALIGIKPVYPIDAGISNIISPSGLNCVNIFGAQITFKNFGSNVLTSCNIKYTIDSGPIQTYSWTGSLARGLDALVTLPTFTLNTQGTHTLTCFTDNPNGSLDADLSNNQSVSIFISNTTVTLPLSEGFENKTNLPEGWVLFNPDNDAAWQVVNSIARTGSNCIGFNNHNGDNSTDMSGKQDWFYTQPYDFYSATTANLSFDVAYTPLNVGGILSTDTLVVLYSTDCGITWNEAYRKGGVELATASTYTTKASAWAPSSSSQWRTENVDLAAITGQSSILFAFENISDWAEWIYLDNITITQNTSVGVNSNEKQSIASVYPNPAHNSLSINSNQEINSIYITDVVGKIILDKQCLNNSQQIKNIDISSLSEGIYFIKINLNQSSSQTIRFIKN